MDGDECVNIRYAIMFNDSEYQAMRLGYEIYFSRCYDFSLYFSAMRQLIDKDRRVHVTLTETITERVGGRQERETRSCESARQSIEFG